MSYEVVVVESFEKQIKRLAKKYKSLKEDIKPLIESLETDPSQGDYLGNDCYKIRLGISSKGKGKRGGARIITCVKVVNKNVYLLSIYDKSERENLDDLELYRLLKLAEII